MKDELLLLKYLKALDALEKIRDALPEREWVELTDEQIKHIYICETGWSISDGDPMLIDFARAIEAKLKEKNT